MSEGGLTECATRDNLRNRAAHALGMIVKLGNEQLDCLHRNDQKRLLEIDQELEIAFGEKERALGAWREHREEHGC